MASYPTGAQPMPTNGLRELTGPEATARAKAMACLRDKFSECQGQVHVNLFFDGTGNNWNWKGTFVEKKTDSTQTQEARNGHSNVARLWRASFQETDNGLFSYYIPGVGTPFPDVGDTNPRGSMLGGASALYGAERINWAIIQVFNSIHRYLMNDAVLIDQNTALILVKEMSKVSLVEGFKRQTFLTAAAKKLENIVKNHQRRLKSLNIAVFGFSRGAAEARAFVHWLYEIVEPWGSGCGYNLAGVPMNLTFLGLFDTVASVGMAAMFRISEGKLSWADGEMMSIHPEVKKCVHFVALHEQRMNFPVDLATTGTEVLYPGMHSDVGGGYTPGGQGKDCAGGKTEDSAKLSQIPLIDMHYEAIKAGVPMMTMEEIRARPALARSFGCHPQLIADYNAWLAGHGVAGGDHKTQIRGHCKQFVQWKGMRLREGEQNLVAQPFFKRCDDEKCGDKYDLLNANRDFGNLIEKYQKERKARQQQKDHPVEAAALRAVSGSGQILGDNPDPEAPDLMDAALSMKAIPAAATKLFDDYVHDSLAGFYMKTYTELNIPAFSTDGYLRYRSVFNISSTKQKSECIDPQYAPPIPAIVPSMNQIFDQLGSIR